MGYSNVVTGSFLMQDIVSPGDPILELLQVSQVELEARVTLPETDANGDPLTGMTELSIALLLESGGVNPFEGIAAANIISHAETNGGQSATIFLTEDDAGLMKAKRFSGLEINSIYWVAIAVKDDS